MNIWWQREQRVPLADSTTTEYRYCLDALIATIEDMKRVDEEFFVPGEVIERAEERAADLAHRLFERWIEVTGPCGVCEPGPCPECDEEAQ